MLVEESNAENGKDGMRNNPSVAFFQEDEQLFPLTLRTWMPGEKIRPLGMKGSRLISDVLIDRKVPRAKRKEILVLTDGQNVLWLVGVCRSAWFPMNRGSGKVWRFESVVKR